MRPFPMLAGLMAAALLAAAVLHPEAWLSDTVLIAVAASLAATFAAFNWWELWTTRHDR
jgi:hypothetical protein